MATISHNDRAPSDVEVTYSLGSAESFTLTGDATHEVPEPPEDADEQDVVDYTLLVGNARSHPWLKVDVPQPEVDADSAQAVEVDYPKTAIDASLDQDEAEYEGKEDVIAETLAADEEQGDEPTEVEPTNEPVQPVQE